MLYIMRHGKTDWNRLHKLQGRTDIPLNAEGRLMAEKAKIRFLILELDYKSARESFMELLN